MRRSLLPIERSSRKAISPRLCEESLEGLLEDISKTAGFSAIVGRSPGTETHRTAASHWCADCWHWVVDCDHLVWPLRIPHRPTPHDSFVHSIADDPIGRRLEIFYRWESAAQFQPITASVFSTDLRSIGRPFGTGCVDETAADNLKRSPN